MNPSRATPASHFPCSCAGIDAAVGEACRIRHLMRAVVAAGLNLREHPGLAFPLVKLAEAEHVVLGTIAHSADDEMGLGFAHLLPSVLEIAADMRRRLLDRFTEPVRRRVLQGLEGPAPAEEEIRAEADALLRRGADERMGGSELPLSNGRAHRLARRLLARVSTPATWSDLWVW